MERKLYLLSPLQAEFYENESDRMYPDDVMDGRALQYMEQTFYRRCRRERIM